MSVKMIPVEENISEGQLDGQIGFSDEQLGFESDSSEDSFENLSEVGQLSDLQEESDGDQLYQNEFFIAMKKIPTVTNQEHRAAFKGPGKQVVFYDTPQLAAARMLYVSMLAPFRPEKPLTGPISLRVYWCFAATKKHPAGTWKTSKPDTDNMQKLFKDCMTKVGFWKDDAQVVMELVAKRYDQFEGIYVRVQQIPEDLMS